YDLIYLDVGEQEVDLKTDSNLAADDIRRNLETCMRLKRVAQIDFKKNIKSKSNELERIIKEGVVNLKLDDGHTYIPLALIKGRSGLQEITPEQLENVRPFLDKMAGLRELSFVPAFTSISSTFRTGAIPANQIPALIIPVPNWTLTIDPKVSLPMGTVGTNSLFAYKPENKKECYGILPLEIPDKIRIKSLKVFARAYKDASIVVELFRFNLEGTDEMESLAHMKITTKDKEVLQEVMVESSEGKNVTEIGRDYYLTAHSIGVGNAMITGISVTY
ncbi:MAG: hypothetical protein AAF766_14580, partial [Cyanobacteria bacterium P01_D01_bin.14]